MQTREALEELRDDGRAWGMRMGAALVARALRVGVDVAELADVLSDALAVVDAAATDLDEGLSGRDVLAVASEFES